MRDTADSFDWPALSAVVDGYVAHLHAAPAGTPVREAKEVLRLLRENRRYDDLLEVADALLANHVTDAGVKRAVAQGLVDRGRAATALLVFRSIHDDPETGAEERAEALGGIGRCSKELFLTTSDAASRAGYLTRAYSAYRTAYDKDAENTWAGINAVALLARAAREKVTIDDAVHAPLPPSAARSQARRLADDVLQVVSDLPEPDVWALATACEACVALGDDEEAVGWAGQIVDGGEATAFELASLIRQLTTVWQLDTNTPPGDRLLPMLRSELLRRHGGDVVVDAADLRSGRLDPESEESLEKVFGDTRFVGLPWYRKGLERCRAVARIETESTEGYGTGFLVAGAALHPALPPLVCLTNGHVVPEGLDPHDAYVAFHGLDADADDEIVAEPVRCKVKRVWWHEPSQAPGLDTTVLELEDLPAGVEPLPVATELPRLGGRTSQRAYIIGHPRGLETPQYSLQDNVILDYDDVLLHYRSPTEPGSSGSPVFDNQWRLIGLHHAGRTDTPRLHNQGGTYAANEAILLSAVVARLAERPPGMGEGPGRRRGNARVSGPVVVRVPPGAPDEAVLRTLLAEAGVLGPVPVVVLVGGAGKMEMGGSEWARCRSLLGGVLVPFVAAHDVALVDGGTDSGVMAIAGAARAALGTSGLHVGVVAAGTVTLPGEPAPEGSGDDAPADAEPHHSHLVVVPGSSWGDEAPWLGAVAGALADGRPTVTVLANGGDIAWEDVRLSVGARRPVLALAGTGRTADDLAAQVRDGLATGDAVPLVEVVADAGTLEAALRRNLLG